MFSTVDPPFKPTSTGAHQTESIIVAQCLEWLALHRIRAWRNNTGAVKIDGRWIKYGHPGSGDIMGVIAPVGIHLEVECKTASGKQSRIQILRQRLITEDGGIYILSRNSQDLERNLVEHPRFAALGLDLKGRDRIGQRAPA
jgi:hypothetical protein